MGRCTAKSKQSGKRCRNWAIRRKSTCRFHGGKSTGPRTKKGKEASRLAHIKHGYRTRKNQESLHSIRITIKDLINFNKSFK